MPGRRALLRILAILTVTVSRRSGGQPAAKVAQIGYLSSGAARANPHLPQAFRDGLRELGWVEGRNVHIEYRFAEGNDEWLHAFTAELTRLKPDLLVASPTLAAVAAKRATATIPIVMVSVGDPVGLGLVESLARPGGNVTGMSFDVGLESFGKCLEILRQLLPDAARIAVLTNPENPAQRLALKEITAVAGKLGVRLQGLEARAPDELDGVVAAVVRERTPALLVVTEGLFLRNRARLIALAARHRLPVAYGTREFVDDGGLLSYGPSLAESFRRAATYVDRILRGTPPRDLPVEQPTRFELLINLKTAGTLGLAVPPVLLNRADELIQ